MIATVTFTTSRLSWYAWKHRLHALGWKNCPVAWKGQFTRGDQRKPTIMLEAVASIDFWIWHTFFGVAGSNTDINVLDQSPLFNDVLNGFTLNVHFVINGTTY